jgi:hypothetical protein
MTSRAISVNAQWALQGKTLGRAGYRVLACSNGDLSLENFTEVLGRFSLGTREALPQVVVSYPVRTYYLGLAIHKWATDARVEGDQLPGHDDDGRPTVITSYFCVPYSTRGESDRLPPPVRDA